MNEIVEERREKKNEKLEEERDKLLVNKLNRENRRGHRKKRR